MDLEELERDPGYRAFQESFLTDGFVTPDDIYMDFRLLKDLDVGAAFSLGQERGCLEEIWTKVQTHGEVYRTRTCLDPVRALRLPFTSEEISARIADPAHAREVYRLSPMTSVIFSLLDALLTNANHSAATERPGDVTLHLNTHPMVLDPVLRDAMMTWLGESLKVNVSLFSRPVEDIPVRDWLAWDEYWIWHMKAFSESDAIMDALNAFKFAKKRLFSVLSVSGDRRRSKEEIDREILLTRSAYELSFSLYKPIDIRAASFRIERKTGHDRDGQ